MKQWGWCCCPVSVNYFGPIRCRELVCYKGSKASCFCTTDHLCLALVLSAPVLTHSRTQRPRSPSMEPLTLSLAPANLSLISRRLESGESATIRCHQSELLRQLLGFTHGNIWPLFSALLCQRRATYISWSHTPTDGWSATLWCGGHTSTSTTQKEMLWSGLFSISPLLRWSTVRTNRQCWR